MMNEAVTGTASPSSSTAIAASSAHRNRLPPATSMMIPDRLRPRPVSVTTATMIPAAAQVAATGSTARAPAASASNTRTGVIRCFGSRNESRNASTVA